MHDHLFITKLLHKYIYYSSSKKQRQFFKKFKNINFVQANLSHEISVLTDYGLTAYKMEAWQEWTN